MFCIMVKFGLLVTCVFWVLFVERWVFEFVWIWFDWAAGWFALVVGFSSLLLCFGTFLACIDYCLLCGWKGTWGWVIVLFIICFFVILSETKIETLMLVIGLLYFINCFGFWDLFCLFCLCTVVSVLFLICLFVCDWLDCF